MVFWWGLTWLILMVSCLGKLGVSNYPPDPLPTISVRSLFENPKSLSVRTFFANPSVFIFVWIVCAQSDLNLRPK